MWVIDTATHFENAILTRLREALRVDHQFAVAYSPWSNGTWERMVKEVVSSLRSIFLQQRRAVSEWVDVLPAVQWALNTAFRPRYGSTPYHVMFGRAPKTSCRCDLQKVTVSCWLTWLGYSTKCVLSCVCDL